MNCKHCGSPEHYSRRCPDLDVQAHHLPTLRQRYAMAALTGLSYDNRGSPETEIAELAFAYADAMLARTPTAPQGAEPVAWVLEFTHGDSRERELWFEKPEPLAADDVATPLYAAPQGAEIARETWLRMLARGPQLVECGPEPGLREILIGYYRDCANPEKLADDYLRAALTPIDAETKNA